jgi:DNA-binding transcriptional regulator YdaS (Cro superfamily)
MCGSRSRATKGERGADERRNGDVDINYLFHRQQAERSRANAATSDAARKIHEQLASEYERMIEDATGGRITFVGTRQHPRHD